MASENERIDRLIEAVESLAQELRRSNERTDARLTRVENGLQALENRTQALENSTKALENSVKALESSVKALESSVKALEIRVQSVETAQIAFDKRQTEFDKRQQKFEKRQTEFGKRQTEFGKRQTEFEKRQTEFEKQLQAFDYKLQALGARWGTQSENSFRNAVANLLEDVGFIVRKYRKKDADGVVHGHPCDIEIDVAISNGRTYLIEIKSAIDRYDIYRFDRIIKFYESNENKKADRKMIVSPFVKEMTIEVAGELGIQVCTNPQQAS